MCGYHGSMHLVVCAIEKTSYMLAWTITILTLKMNDILATSTHFMNLYTFSIKSWAFLGLYCTTETDCLCTRAGVGVCCSLQTLSTVSLFIRSREWTIFSRLYHVCKVVTWNCPRVRFLPADFPLDQRVNIWMPLVTLLWCLLHPLDVH